MDLQALRRRTVEIDYKHQHRHASGSLSALPVIAEIYESMGFADVFILSKGHSAPAWYAVLEAQGFLPDVSKPHPDRDPANGIVCTTGSLGHGLPIAVGIALAKRIRGEGGVVHVLLGDGECLEGTTWESLNLAEALDLWGYLAVYVDCNGWQGSCQTIGNAVESLSMVFPITAYDTRRGEGSRYLEAHQDWHTHTITPEEYKIIMEEMR